MELDKRMLEQRCTRIYVVARKIDVERRVRQTRVILVCYASLLGKDEADIEFFTTCTPSLTIWNELKRERHMTAI
jgi:hypothetical protein